MSSGITLVWFIRCFPKRRKWTWSQVQSVPSTDWGPRRCLRLHSLCTLSNQCWISNPLQLQKGILFEVRPCKGAMKSKWACHSLWVTVPQLPHSQEEKAKTLTQKGKIPRTWSLPSRDGSYEKINFCYFKLIILWLFLLWQTQQKIHSPMNKIWGWGEWHFLRAESFIMYVSWFWATVTLSDRQLQEENSSLAHGLRRGQFVLSRGFQDIHEQGKTHSGRSLWPKPFWSGSTRSRDWTWNQRPG